MRKNDFFSLFTRPSFWTWFCITVFSFRLDAQQSYMPLNKSLSSFNAPILYQSEDSTSRFSSFFPAPISDHGLKTNDFRSYSPQNAADSIFLLRKKYSEYSWFRRKVLYENFIVVDTGKVYITIDPLINLSTGVEYYGGEQRELRMNTRGLMIRADIGKKFSIETYFYENQAVLPTYINDFTEITEVVPGQGRVKEFKEDGFDFAQSGGYFSYAPSKHVNIQFGHHKHFIGDGYRSLILSDNAFNYPFLRINTAFIKNKLRYSVLYAVHQDLNRLPSDAPSEAPFQRKGGSYHFLEYQFNKAFRINIFQGVIWPFQNDSGEVIRPYEMLNPLILSYPLTKGQDDNNSILGFGFNARLKHHLEGYGQFATDDSEFSNTSLQLGLKTYPIKNSYLQVEYNRVDQNMYGNTLTDSLRSNAFVHYNEAIAFKGGNNAEEIIVRAGYRYLRMLALLQYNHLEYKSIDSQVDFFNLELAYILNPATNLKIFVSATRRFTNEIIDPVTNIFNIGIKTDLRNIYYDF